MAVTRLKLVAILCALAWSALAWAQSPCTPAQIPGCPTTPSGPNSARLCWTHTGNDTGGNPTALTGFKAYYGTGGAMTSSQAIAGASTREVTLIGLNPGLYTLAVAAISGNGEGAKSCTVTKQVTAAPTLGNPTQSPTFTYSISTGAAMSVPVIDGTVFTATPVTSGLTVVLPALTTTVAGRVAVAVSINGGAAGIEFVDTVTSSPTGLTFTRRKEQSTGGAADIEWWVATSAGALSSETITVTSLHNIGFGTATAFGIKSTTGFDANGSLPNSGLTDPRTVSTTANNTLVVGAFRYGSVASPTVPSGWTLLSGVNFSGVFYKTFTSPQTSLSVPAGGSGVGDSNASIADAFAGTDDDTLLGQACF